jgi:two-component system LytT family response regulator
MSQAITAIIVDDAAQARKLLRLMLAEYAPQVLVKGEAANVAEALQLAITAQPDVVFLDIEMPGKSGLQLAEELHKAALPCDVVFTTAYNKYAVQAFRLSAIDYLLKPIDESQLIEAVEKVIVRKNTANGNQRLGYLVENLKPGNQDTLSISIMNGYEFVNVGNIISITADGSYVNIMLADGNTMVVSKNLKYFEQALEGFPQFVRVHRSYLINLQQMKRFERSGRGIIIMNDNSEIDLARDRRDGFFVALEQFMK